MSGLELSGFSVDRAGFNIVRDVTMRVPKREVTVLIGPNGAGKTTLLEGIMGVIPAKGRLTIDGQSLAQKRIEARAAAGLSLVEQGRTIFADLTVQENLEIVADDPALLAHVYEVFPELVKRRDSLAVLLSGGEQQMLVIGRALMSRPQTILLDEMSFGLSPILVSRLMPVVRRIADEGAAVLLVEQFAHLALQIGDRAYVMNHGEIILEEEARVMLKDPGMMQAAYLGET